jgi:thiol-disulfide isomerase/thioredoxin
MRRPILLPFYLVFLYTLTCTGTFSQRIIIPLEHKYGENFASSYVKPTALVKNPKDYQGIDTVGFLSWEVRELVLFMAQYYKERAGGAYKPSYFENYVQMYNVDTSHVTSRRIKRNTVSSLVRVNSKNDVFVTVDANNNSNFLDDSCYIFKPGDVKRYPEVPITFDYFDGRDIVSKNIKFSINIYDNSDLPGKLTFINKNFREGTFQCRGKNYVIQLDDQYYGLYTGSNFVVNLRDIAESKPSRYIYKPGELIDIDHQLYEIDNLSQTILSLSYKNSAKDGGGKAGTRAPSIVSHDLLDGSPIYIPNRNSKYTIIDFWGSWCPPCIDAIPELRSLNKKFHKQGVNLLSIAYDKTTDSSKVISLINKFEMKWSHMLVNRDKGEVNVQNYKVQIFPTTLLIDSEGVVVLRGEGKSILYEIDTFLTKLLKPN